MLKFGGWIPSTISVVVRAAFVPLMFDLIISVANGRATVYTFPVIFPLVLLALAFEEWWKKRRSARGQTRAPRDE